MNRKATFLIERLVSLILVLIVITLIIYGILKINIIRDAFLNIFT